MVPSGSSARSLKDHSSDARAPPFEEHQQRPPASPPGATALRSYILDHLDTSEFEEKWRNSESFVADVRGSLCTLITALEPAALLPMGCGKWQEAMGGYIRNSKKRAAEEEAPGGNMFYLYTELAMTGCGGLQGRSVSGEGGNSQRFWRFGCGCP